VAKIKATISAKVRRGPNSWDYLYTFLGFTLTIETGIMGLIKPIDWPCNVVILLSLGAITVYLFFFNGWFQNKLIGLKNGYENKLR
jgi:hypothetical protein